MWGYQPHFRINCQTQAESLFDLLDRGLEPKVSLIGFLQSNRTDRHSICVDPESLEEIIPNLNDLNSKAKEILTNHFDKNTFYTGPGVQEKKDKQLLAEVNRLALEEILNNLNTANQSISFVSNVLTISDYQFYVILELNRFVYESHIHLKKRDSEQRFKLRLSLIECAVECYLHEIKKNFKETRDDEFFDLEIPRSDELLRDAATNFIYTISWAGRNGMGLHGLVETCNKISQAKYESEEVNGTILVAKEGHSDIDLLVQIKEPFSIRDHRKTRKLLEQANGNLHVITNAFKVLGLGELKPTYDPSTESVFIIKFTGLHCWDVMHCDHILMQMRYGIPQFAQESIDKNKFAVDARRIFSGIKTEQVENLFQLSIAITKVNKGAMLIISRDAANEAMRLKNRAIVLNPFKLKEELLLPLASIDGGILIDESGLCYANGLILDGIVGHRGDSSRGSRYNSAITYQEFFELKKATMIVVVSEDGMVDLIPGLMPQIEHSDIITVIEILEEIKNNGYSESYSFDEAMHWLQNHNFYLTPEECKRINELNDSISEKFKGDSVRIIYEHFSPHTDMNNSYYFENKTDD
ncbi:diadenylate cyclase [Pedobacter cryoconitis]|uniref:diadenylate cyclase n=1 Tax=Pedobacter cryoconitis TaxID=188932 RepID=UPI00161C8AD0|nr:diadenylate cyclase [Pedobacter cryoconitis]